MMGFRFLVVLLVVLALSNVIEANFFKKVGKALKKTATKVGDKFKDKKFLCKVGFGVACPVGLSAAGAAVAVGTGGTATAAAAAGATAGIIACEVAQEQCKRSALYDPQFFTFVPFSPNFADYDKNRDKLITYEEFVFSVMVSLPLGDPEHLHKPFMFADADDDGVLTTDEFKAAPFIWADEWYDNWKN